MELVALAVALTLTATTAVAGRRASKAAPPAPEPTLVREIVHRSSGTFSLSRPASIPSSAPMGRDAKDLLYDAFIQHPGYAATASAILGAFREAEMGNPQRQCDLIDDLIEPDCHLASLFDKRNEAVAGKDFVIQAGGQGADAELGAHVLRTVFADMPMVETFQHLLTFNKYGWAGVEIDWDVKVIEGRPWIVPVYFTAVRARRFRISNLLLDGVNDEPRLYADITRPRGDALRPYKWIFIRRDAATPLACSGLMRNCAWPALGKRYAFRDWVVFSDKFGKPLPIATYDEDGDDTAKDTATEVVQNIGNDIGAVVPKSISVDFKEAKGVDNSKTHGGLIAHCNAEMSKRINGSTLANDNAGSGGASYALGDVHDSVRWEAVQYDASRVETAFNIQVFAAFMRFNGLAGPTPKMKIQVVRDLAPTTRIDVASKFKNLLGGKLSASQMSQELGFREPTDDKDDLPGAPAGAEPMAKTPNPKITETT